MTGAGTRANLRPDGSADERKAVAVVDADWIRPTHNKQDFDDPDGAFRWASTEKIRIDVGKDRKELK